MLCQSVLPRHLAWEVCVMSVCISMTYLEEVCLPAVPRQLVILNIRKLIMLWGEGIIDINSYM